MSYVQVSPISATTRHTARSNTKNEQCWWCLLNVRDRDCSIYGWPRVASCATTPRAILTMQLL